jgi:hypothetical protein
VLVERCWLCLEQPAVTTALLEDGRPYPLCDVCAADHPGATGPERLTDPQTRRILGESA